MLELGFGMIILAVFATLAYRFVMFMLSMAFITFLLIIIFAADAIRLAQ